MLINNCRELKYYKIVHSHTNLYHADPVVPGSEICMYTITNMLCRQHLNTILSFGRTRKHGMLTKVWMVGHRMNQSYSFVPQHTLHQNMSWNDS